MTVNSQLEALLCRVFGRKHALVTGRAATGIYLACQAIRRSRHRGGQSFGYELAGGKLIVPAICCPSPASVALYANLEPLFCDIDPNTFNLCPKALESLLRKHPDVVAVLAVHLYGQPADINRLQSIAHRFGAALIEDAAQALGGSVGNRPLGSFGDVSVVSFGHTKQIDVGWGGAVLTDNDDLMQQMQVLLAELPIRPACVDQQFTEYRRMVYLLLQRRKEDPAIDELFLLLPENYRQMHLFRSVPVDSESVIRAIEDLHRQVVQRRSASLHYRERLQHPCIRHSSRDDGASPWRHSLRVPGNLQGVITHALRRADIDASNWYPSLHRWYRLGREQSPDELREAVRHEQEVVNLWVTPGMSMDRIDKTCKIILDAIENIPATKVA